MTHIEPTAQVVTTATEPAVLGPMTRWLRTVLQVVLAVAAAVPTAAALFNLSAETSAKVTAFTGAVVVIASALHNVANAKKATP